MADSTLKIKVAISSDFLTAFAQIPRQQQAKVQEFVTKFRANPMLPERRMCSIHPETGSLQIIDVEDVLPSTPLEPTAQDTGLFAQVRDRHLVQVGVPEVLLPLVRSLKTEADLDQVADQLPQEVYEALFFLAAGYALEDVLRELEKPEEAPPVDTTDYASALDNPDSQRRFYVADDDLELQAILTAPLEKWRVFLHPSQRKVVERDWNGPVRVLGGAGTGKTVAAMHRAKWLAQQAFPGANDRILFTTFTRNLAADIQDNLRKICPEDSLRRIEVINLDRWVSDFLRRNGYAYQIDYGQRTAALWERALTVAPDKPQLEASFYREEWERVIQPHGLTSATEYFKVSRVGRGVQLSRLDRKAIWPVFEEYRILLNEHGLKEREDALRDARLLLEEKGAILPYKAIVVDEAQDMGRQAFLLIRHMVPGDGAKNDLFIVGDAHQRIYRHTVVLGRCGINIRGRSRKLRINYRTTDETRRWAVSLLEGINSDDLDAGLDDQKGYKSLLHGSAPEVRGFDSFRDEVEFLAERLQQLVDQGELLATVCLVARTNKLLKQYESALGEKDISTYFISRNEAENRTMPGLRLATMHRVKGLEFDRVFIAGVNEETVPYTGRQNDSSDPIVQRGSETQERALLYVAATRAKQEVIVTSFGRPSPFLSVD